MAVLETLRRKGGFLLVGIIGVALLSFVLGDMFGNSSSGSMFSSQALGEVSGYSIEYQEYQSRVDYYNNIYRVMYGQNANNEAVTEEVREQAWQSLIRQYTVEQKYDALNLRVSSDELFELIQGSTPSPIILRHFANPQTGDFDRAFLLRYLQNLDQADNIDGKTYWLFLEKEIAQQRLQAKFTALMTKSMYSTDIDAQNVVNNGKNNVNIAYVLKPYSAISDSTLKVSSKDLKAFYKANKQNYKQIASRDVEYISFAIEPSEDDVNAVKDWIEKLSIEFKTTSDVRQFAALHSDVAFNANYFKKGELPDVFDKFAFSSDKKDMLTPILHENSYKVARIADIRMMPDSVRARHILLDVRKGMDSARKVADSIKTALRKGANFEVLASQYSVDNAANEQGGDLGWFAQSAMVKSFADSCFFATKGRIMIVETQFGIHIVEVTNRGKEEKKVQLAIIERSLEPSRATRERIFANANDFATAATYEDFVAKAKDKAYTLRTASRINLNDKKVQSLENARELVRWAYEKKMEGSISPVFEINNNFVVGVLKTIREDGYTNLEQVASQIAPEILREKKAAVIVDEFKVEKPLAELAEEHNLRLNTANNISFGTTYIPNLGMEPKLIAAVSILPVGKISKPIIGNAGVYVCAVLEQNIKPEDPSVNQEKGRLKNMATMRMGYELLDVMHREAEVKDWRGKVLF
ncbi:MAG: peptidylprolyl isomerase [Bacteroidales bacterium]